MVRVTPLCKRHPSRFQDLPGNIQNSFAFLLRDAGLPPTCFRASFPFVILEVRPKSLLPSVELSSCCHTGSCSPVQS